MAAAGLGDSRGGSNGSASLFIVVRRPIDITQNRTEKSAPNGFCAVHGDCGRAPVGMTEMREASHLPHELESERGESARQIDGREERPARRALTSIWRPRRSRSAGAGA